MTLQTTVVTFVRYLRLKLLVGFIRLAVRILAPTPRAHPDSVLRIPSRDKDRTIRANLYRPVGTVNEEAMPVLLNFYGSGFALPLYGADDEFCRLVATTAEYVVLDVEYRLGPEHPFPAAINDVQDVVKYVLSRPDEYKPSQVSVSGFSSGGTLALIAPTLFPKGQFQSVLAFYPATDLATDPAMRRAPASTAKPRSPFTTRLFRESYIGTMDPRDPRISPAFSDTTNYPSKMLVVTGELDSSALEAEELADRAKADGLATGRTVVSKRMKGCGHAFDKKKDGVSVLAKDEVYDLAIEILKSEYTS